MILIKNGRVVDPVTGVDEVMDVLIEDFGQKWLQRRAAGDKGMGMCGSFPCLLD